MAKGDVQVMLVVAYNSEDPAQPPELMIHGEELHPLIGKIITSWSLMEQESRLLTTALLTQQHRAERAWEGLPFEKRWELMTIEWGKFAAGAPELLKEMTDITAEMRKGKFLRDGLSHKRIRAEMTERGNCIRFHHENPRFPWSRQFYVDHFEEAHRGIARACGRLFRLTVPQHAQHFSSLSKSRLQQLPDMGSARFPMPAKPKRPPRP